ncbi:ATP-binding protein [Clostridium ganghwense]|uniref:ATP-binding protein n=1 Tax=Clostridium ganghwense TaxID=312089 RepID=A0ABT4CTL3_9CLOT|nr:ATP-binding protein [Clostridium ganghwense]MCY6371773.1 ATP-binding protein [Clostridium ganghwense]
MELVVISGKGGTGKTTISIALSELAKDVVKADCDVDAPNLYLMYRGEDVEEHDFITGNKAIINSDKCIRCGKCEEVCRFDAIKDYKINEYKCEGCTACSLICPNNAIEIKDDIGAKTIVTKTSKGIISRAKMEIGADGSGKLITEVRKNAKKYAGNNIIIIDGSPGIGCPVISSITGTDVALVVTEPTKSGLEDMKRVLSVCDYFSVKALVCINKSDINKEITEEIKSFCRKENYEVVGEISYDDTVMKAINELKAVTEYKESKVNLEIIKMWAKINKILYK